MSTNTTNIGQNISNALFVLRETYKNISMLLTELDRVAENENFIPLTPRFLRWKSDSHYSGWLTSNFIKLYQSESDSPLSNIPDMRDGYIYGIEVDLENNEYPVISLIIYKYDYSNWTRIPTISDHWVFWGPFREEKHFSITESNGLWEASPLEASKSRYWGMQKAIAKDIPLLSITSTEDISKKIFQELNNLQFT